MKTLKPKFFTEPEKAVLLEQFPEEARFMLRCHFHAEDLQRGRVAELEVERDDYKNHFEAADQARITSQERVAELTKENELLRAELKRRVPMHFSGEINLEVDLDPDDL